VVRLLLIDEDVVFGETYARMLRPLGFTVDLAHDLTQAREIFDRSSPDVVICPDRLPDGSGTEFLRDLQGEQSDAPMRTALILTTSDPATRSEFTTLLKPFRQGELLKAMLRAAQR